MKKIACVALVLTACWISAQATTTHRIKLDHDYGGNEPGVCSSDSGITCYTDAICPGLMAYCNVNAGASVVRKCNFEADSDRMLGIRCYDRQQQGTRPLHVYVWVEDSTYSAYVEWDTNDDEYDVHLGSNFDDDMWEYLPIDFDAVDDTVAGVMFMDGTTEITPYYPYDCDGDPTDKDCMVLDPFWAWMYAVEGWSPEDDPTIDQCNSATTCVGFAIQHCGQAGTNGRIRVEERPLHSAGDPETAYTCNFGCGDSNNNDKSYACTGGSYDPTSGNNICVVKRCAMADGHLESCCRVVGNPSNSCCSGYGACTEGWDSGCTIHYALGPRGGYRLAFHDTQNRLCHRL